MEEVAVLCNYNYNYNYINVNGYLQTDTKVCDGFDISGHIGNLPKQQAWDIELLPRKTINVVFNAALPSF